LYRKMHNKLFFHWANFSLLLTIEKFSLFQRIIWNRKILFFWFHGVPFTFTFVGMESIQWTNSDRKCSSSLMKFIILYNRSFPNWYFSRIDRMQRRPPLSKLNPAMKNDEKDSSRRLKFVLVTNVFEICLDVVLVD